MGHRKKMLKAIRTIASEDRKSAKTIELTAGAETSLYLQPRDAERRQITVMFCDLVGSTQLSTKFDLEDLQLLLEAYRQACNTAITRYAGTIAGYFGDGVMAFFGWPRAHEDDAVRAVHAALEILPAVTKISAPVTLALRVGICSGPVVVGTIESTGTASLIDAVGETPNIAARLQTLAAPNTVLVSESTKRLLSASFELKNLGTQELKGLDRPLRVYQVLGAKNISNRFEASHVDLLAPLVGRSTEIDFLIDRWGKAKESDGQLIIISGIAGVGKSRLIHEFKLRINCEPHLLLSFQCSQYHLQSAFFPIIDQIERMSQILSRDSDETKFVKIKDYLYSVGMHEATEILLIGNLLSIDTGYSDQFSESTPQQIKNKTISAIVDMIRSMSTQLPTICIFEDIHWIDPSTLELLELTISRLKQARVLLVLSHRPEFQHTWFTHSNATMYSLTRLSRGEIVEMICDIFNRSIVTPDVVEQIVDKSDGIPLFVEELANSALESSIGSRLADGNLSRANQSIAIPETLHDALMERIDRVPQGRNLAQIAAVIGRDFSYEILSVASGVGENDLTLVLSMLEDADVIYRVGISPNTRFAFKHVLLRDAVYNSLIRNKRRKIHGQIANILANEQSRFEDYRPEILAYHFNEAGDYSQAVRFWLESGRRAVAHFANAEAIAHFRMALEPLSAMAETPERFSREIEIQLALGIPLIAVRGYAAQETRDAFARARTLCLKTSSHNEYFQALYGLWGHSWMSGKHNEALEMANEFLSKSRTSADKDLMMVAHRTMGSTLLTLGDFRAAKQHFETTISLSTSRDKRPLYDQYMVDPQVASLLLLSWNLWFLGYPDQSIGRVSEAVYMSEAIRHQYSVAFAHYMTSVVHILRGDPKSALSSAEKSLEVSKEQRFLLYVLLSNIARARALGEMGRLEEAQTEIERGLEAARSEGVGFMLPMMESWLADIHARRGECETALSIVERALARIDNITGRSWESELHRQKGQILLGIAPERVTDAESHFRAAIHVARRQYAKSFELRATTNLANLLRTQGKIDEGRHLLEAVYHWFREGLDTVDLSRARLALVNSVPLVSCRNGA